jgi:hypothetical protein
MAETGNGGNSGAKSGWVLPRIAAFLAAASVLGVIWTVVQFWNPIKERDVTVVFEEHLGFSLPKEASSLNKLTMMYDGKPVPTVSLLRLSVINSGNLPVQPPDGQKEWTLALRSTEKHPLEIVGEVVPTPGVSISTERVPGRPDIVHLKIGLLKAKESVSMQVAMIGGDTGRYGIAAEEVGNRIPDLRLATTLTSVQHRIMNAFVPPTLVLSVLLLAASAIREYRRGASPFNKPMGPWALVTNIAGLMFVLVFSSVFLAGGLSWLLSWLVYIVAFR